MRNQPPARSLFDELRAQLRAWTGIVLSPRDADSALAALAELAVSRGRDPASQLLALSGPGHLDERQLLIDRLAIGTTWFMRESAGLRTLVEALVRDHGSGHAVTLWSAGCSTGQEPYALAMALIEAGLRPRILATDVSQQALRTAAAARYDSRQVAALPAAWQRRFTAPAGPGLSRIRSEVTSVVRFALHNLAVQPAPPSGWNAVDAVICRNVLIYFERAEATAAVARMARVCRPGGYILLSAAERPLAWMTEALQELDRSSDTVLLRTPALAHAAPDSEPPARLRPRPHSSQSPAAATPAPPPAATSEALAAAAKALRSGDPARSLQLVDAILARDRLVAPAQLLRGLALKRSGALREAAAALRCARFLCADGAWLAPYHLGLICEQLGELDEAEEAYRHTLAILAAGGSSGLLTEEDDEAALFHTIADACRARLQVLRQRAAL
ncbi:MAG: CheR family methyltransferase [Polyangia bacterium]